MDILFQSTFPVRGRTVYFDDSGTQLSISIHLPREGKDSEDAQNFFVVLCILDKFSPFFAARVPGEKREAGHCSKNMGILGCEGVVLFMGAFGSHRSDDQGAAGVVAGFGAVVGDFFRIVVPQVVDAQAVLFLVHDLGELGFQCPELGGIHQAFEDAVLHPLAAVQALFSDPAQAAASGGILGIYVIADEYKHTSSLPQERRVSVQVSPEASGQQQGLDVGHQAPGDLFLQIGMGDGLLLPFLPELQEFAPPVIR